MLINRRYEIIARLGCGSVGEVFKAIDTLEEKDVTLKIAKRGKIPEEKLANEFKITSEFSHPNIVSVFNFGIVRTTDYGDEFLGRKFIVAEFCEKDLLNAVSELDHKAKLEIISQICYALTAIHRAGYIHRDLKPENILYDPSTKKAKITDLGLAVSSEKIDPQNLPAGTLHYIAPEILRGEKYDQKADIYSLGILMYQILEGSLPFEIDNPVEVIKWHLSQKEIKTVKTPPELASLISKMLSPQPEQRPNGATDVINSLSKFIRISSPEIYKIKKPIGKDDAIEFARKKLNTLLDQTAETNIVLIIGANGLGKSTLAKFIEIEAKLLGYETLFIATLDINQILNATSKSSLFENLTPELRIKFEKLKQNQTLNQQVAILLSEFIAELILNSDIPTAVFIDEISQDAPEEIFLNSLCKKLYRKNKIALFITSSDENSLDSLQFIVDKITLRPFNLNEIKTYLSLKFDLDKATIEKNAQFILDHADGIPMIAEIFSSIVSENAEIKNGMLSGLASSKFDEIVRHIELASPIQRKILNILSASDRPLEIDILKDFFSTNIANELSRLQNAGFVKIEGNRASVSYNALKKYIYANLPEAEKREIHSKIATLYLSRADWEDYSDKILLNFARAGDEDGVGRFAEKGIEVLETKYRFADAIKLCEEIYPIIPSHLREFISFKIAELYFKTENYEKTLSLLEGNESNESLELRADVWWRLGENEKAIELLKNAWKKSETIYEKVKIAVKISTILASSGNAKTALEILGSFKNDKILNLLHQTEISGDFYAVLGITSHLLGKKEKAQNYLETSLERRLNSKNKFKIIAGYNNIANFFNEIGEKELAVKFWKKAIEISDSIGNIEQSAHIYNNIGISYFENFKTELAIKNYEKALNLYKTINNIQGTATTCLNLGEALAEEFRIRDAIEYLLKAKSLFERSNDPAGIDEANSLLSFAYLNVGDTEDALEFFTLTENLTNPLKKFIRGLVHLKKSEFETAEKIFLELAEDEEVKQKKTLFLKTVLSLLKLKFVAGKIDNLTFLQNLMEEIMNKIDNPDAKASILFYFALLMEKTNKTNAMTLLNRSVSEMSEEFAEFKWKAYLKIAQHYKDRGLDARFLQNYYMSLMLFEELMTRIADKKLLNSYIADAENLYFVDLLKKLNP